MSFHHDAAGRPLHVGEIIGGTAVQPYPATVIGTITGFALNTVTVQTDPAFEERHPKTGDTWTLRLDQVFYLGRQLNGRLRDLGMHLAEAGPALFYVTSMELDVRTVTRIDQVAPSEPRDRALCAALIAEALDVLSRGRKAKIVVDDGPTIVYAAGDHTSVTRVDQTNVDNPREWGLCRALLKHAHTLCSEPAPLHLPNTGGQS